MFSDMSQTLHKFTEDFSVVKSTVMNMLALHVSSNKESGGGWYWRISTQITNRQFSKASGKIHGSQGCVRNNTLRLQQQIRFSVLAMKLLSITHLTCQAATDFSGSPVQIIPPPVPDAKYSHWQNSILGERRKETLENASHNVFLVYLGFVFCLLFVFLFCCFFFVCILEERQ